MRYSEYAELPHGWHLGAPAPRSRHDHVIACKPAADTSMLLPNAVTALIQVFEKQSAARRRVASAVKLPPLSGRAAFENSRRAADRLPASSRAIAGRMNTGDGH